MSDRLTEQFGYDRGAPLESRSSRVDGAANLEDLSWNSPRGGRVPAWLLAPRTTGRAAGIVFLHASNRNRDEFLPEARRYAEKGAVCLTITAAHSRPGRARFPSWTSADRQGVIQDVVDLSRAIDVLLGRNDVDPARLAFVGLSYGADYGSVFCAVDGRLRAAALISGGTLRDWYRKKVPGGVRAEYLPLMESVSPDRYLPLVAGTKLLFQSGREDDIYSRTEIEDFQNAARGAKEVVWYDAGHWLNELAEREREAWLVRELRLAAESKS